jgi:hypothetical protein
MINFRRALAVASAIGTAAVGATLVAAPAAFACSQNTNFTFSASNGWFAPTDAPNHFYGINHSDCNYVSQHAANADDFEAFVSSDATDWHGGGIKFVSGSGYTKLYTDLSGWSYFYVEDTGRDWTSDATTIAQ